MYMEFEQTKNSPREGSFRIQSWSVKRIPGGDFIGTKE